MSSSKKRELRDKEKVIVENLLDQMSQGVLPWRPTYRKNHAGTVAAISAGNPQNPITKTVYRGMNWVWLMSQGKSDPRWMTYKQAQSKGWQVKKGAKATYVSFWGPAGSSKGKPKGARSSENEEGGLADEGQDPNRPDATPKSGKSSSFRRLISKDFAVFNAEDIEGIEPLEEWKRRIASDQHMQLGELEDSLIQATEDMGVQVKMGASVVPCYSPSAHVIKMPLRSAFETQGDFIGTLLHECAHATGHPSILDRDMSGIFGSPSYAFEELVAELASVFAGAELCEYPLDTQNHASYLNDWMQGLKDDPGAFMRAALLAAKASDYLCVQIMGDRYENSIEKAASKRQAMQEQKEQEQQEAQDQAALRKPENELGNPGIQDQHPIETKHPQAPIDPSAPDEPDDPDDPGTPGKKQMELPPEHDEEEESSSQSLRM